MKTVYQLTAFLVGHCRYRAGIHHRDVGYFALGGPLHAMFGQSATYGRRLRKVEFTSQSEKSCFHHEIFQTAKVLKKRETATMPLMPRRRGAIYAADALSIENYL